VKILCVCPIGVGNYLLCYPAFVLLKKSMPDASLHLLALREGIAQLARGDVLWDGITVFDPTQLRKNIMTPFRILLALRDQRFDASLNFFPSNTWQYHALPWLGGVKRRYAFCYHVNSLLKLSFLSNHKTPVNAELHDVRQNMSLIASFCGNDTTESPLVFPTLFTEEDNHWARLHAASLSHSKIRIGVHPGSSAEHGMEAKRWAPENFAGLTDYVCQFLGGEAYIFGGADEEPLKIRVARAMKFRAHIVRPVSLQRTAALLSQCTLCICNDSGLMHMAACAGVATVGIFGPTDEKRNGPIGGNTLVIRKKMEGFPLWTACNVGKRSLPKGMDPHANLKVLSVEDAWQQLKPWISRTKPADSYEPGSTHF
jgi:heptosyltransferase I